MVIDQRSPGERLAWARKTAGLTTRELAKAANIGAGYPSAIENGVINNPTVGSVDAICAVFGCTFDWLWRGRGRGPSEAALKKTGEAIKRAAADPTDAKGAA